MKTHVNSKQVAHAILLAPWNFFRGWTSWIAQNFLGSRCIYLDSRCIYLDVTLNRRNLPSGTLGKIWPDLSSTGESVLSQTLSSRHRDDPLSYDF